jgi:hypothetical protein
MCRSCAAAPILKNLFLGFLELTGRTRQDPTKQGNLTGRKIGNSGGGLIKSAFARFLERAIKPWIWTWTILKFRHCGLFWDKLGPLMTPFWDEFGHFGVNFLHLGDLVVFATKGSW